MEVCLDFLRLRPYPQDMSETAEFSLSTNEAAARIGVHRDTLTRWAREGKISHLQLPSTERRFRPSDVDQMIASMVHEAE